MGTMIYKSRDGTRLPSVTTVIGSNLGWNKDVLLKWQARIFREGGDPDKIKKDAADVGTLVHNYIEAYIYNTTVPKSELLQQSTDAIIIAEAGLEQFKRKVKEHNIAFTETEMPLVSKIGYGGTLDFLYTRPGIKCGIGDNKTSKAIYGDYIIQLGGYYGMVIENTKYEPQECLFVKISKDITKPEDEIVVFKFVDIEYIKKGFEAFKELLKLHTFKKDLYKYLETV